MGTFSVWRFDTETGADQAVTTLQELAARQLLTIYDAATVSWPVGAKKPRTRHLNDLAGPGALGGAFWGLVFGLVFSVPLLGALVGGTFIALRGLLANTGISAQFLANARDEFAPGTSGLFVLTRDVVVDEVAEAFSGQRPELLSTSLSPEQEDALRAAFAD